MAVTPTLTATPTSASTEEAGRAGSISFHFVPRPPSARITTRAAYPMTWVISALSKWMLPMPSVPMRTPMPRYTSRLGSPLREEIRTAATATSRTSEQTNRSWLRWWTVSGGSFTGVRDAHAGRMDIGHEAEALRTQLLRYLT